MPPLTRYTPCLLTINLPQRSGLPEFLVEMLPFPDRRAMLAMITNGAKAFLRFEANLGRDGGLKRTEPTARWPTRL